MSRLNLSILLIAVAISAACHARTGGAPHARFVAEAYQAIDEWALERPARRDLVKGALEGMVGVLNRAGDEHSEYYGPRDARVVLDELRGQFGGIGVRFHLMGEPSELILVGMPEPGSPAEAGGIQPNDRVLSIDGEPTTGMSQEEVIDRMRGPVGEPLVLSVLHEGEQEPVSIKLIRAQINVPSIIGDTRLSDGRWRFLLEDDPRIAYLRVVSFGAKTARELRDRLAEAKERGAEAFVLDVRDNEGGALDAAVNVCDLFLPQGELIVSTRGRDRKVEDAYYATGRGDFTESPMAVLINQDTASASEIVAACLQDHDRAVVVGQRSFGKGTVQHMIPIEAGQSYLKLTTADYWRPSNHNIHRRPDSPQDAEWGVKPNQGFEVELSLEQRQAFLEARNRRDMTVLDPETLEVVSRPATSLNGDDDDGDGDANSDPAPPSDDFQDRALQRAARYLQSLLDENL